MTVRSIVPPIAVAAALALSACGSDDKGKSSPEAAEKAVTPAVARAEARRTSLALVQAVAVYRAGNRAQARNLVSEAYLEHFEHVEGPLDARDHELTERLEEAIRDELRRKMQLGAPAAEVTALAQRILGDLTTAQAKLR